MERAVDRAADAVRHQILSGRSAAGTKLPPERRLCDDLGVSRLTLRAALARLEGEGLVQARQGSGVTVLDWRDTGDLALLPYLVAEGEGELLAPFLALRRAVAAEAVALAATRATDAELDALEALAVELANEDDPARLAEGNLAFSRQVVRLSGNVPMTLLLNTVTRVARARPELHEVLAGDVPQVQRSVGGIVALLRSRDPAAARVAVRALLYAVEGRLVGVARGGRGPGDAGTHRAEKEGPK